MISIILFSFLAKDLLTLQPKGRPLAPIPENASYFLQAPVILEASADGHVFIVDWVARVIFHWDATGAFVNTIGKPGQGPGEFNFASAGGPQGYLRLQNDLLHVFDGGKRAVMTFAKDGTYLSEIPLEIQTGRCDAFFVRQDGHYIFANQNFMKEVPTRTLSLFDPMGKFVKDLMDMEDLTFDRQNDGQRVTGIVIKAYSPTLVCNYNPLSDELIAGFSSSPQFSLLTPAGNKTEIKAPLVQKDVTSEDQEEFNLMPWIKNNPFFKASFPEKKAYYDGIIPLSDGSFVIYSITPHSRNVTGQHLDRSGASRGRFQFTCGENGSIQGSQGRLYAIYLDEEDEFAIAEMVLSPAS